MSRVDDLNLFLRVFDSGSISAAARSLDLSVAVASQRLRALETSLGVRLFHRTTRSLTPTPEGEALAEQGRPLVHDLQTLMAGLRQAGTQVGGTLRLTTSATFARQYVSPHLPEFMQRHPQLRLSVDLSDQMHDLVTSGFDLALRIGALEDSSLVARQLAVNRRVLCASPDYLRRRGSPERPDELAQHDCLILVGSQGGGRLADEGQAGPRGGRARGRAAGQQPGRGAARRGGGGDGHRHPLDLACGR